MQDLKKSAIFVLLIMLAIGLMGYVLEAAGNGSLNFLGTWPQDMAKKITKGFGSV